jgi:hypothetical protein
MTKDADAIVIAANGSVYVASVGTALPTSVDGALNAAFDDVGYISEDGVTPTDSRSTDTVNVWQSLYPVRRFNTERGYGIGFSMREWNAVSIPFAFGGGEVVESPADSGNYRYDPPPAEEMDERAMVIDWVDGDRKYRIVIPRGMLDDNVETTIVRTAASDLPITFTALGQDGQLPWYLLSDNEAMAPA